MGEGFALFTGFSQVFLTNFVSSFSVKSSFNHSLFWPIAWFPLKSCLSQVILNFGPTDGTLRSLAVEKIFQEVRMMTICLRHNTGIRDLACALAF